MRGHQRPPLLTNEFIEIREATLFIVVVSNCGGTRSVAKKQIAQQSISNVANSRMNAAAETASMDFAKRTTFHACTLVRWYETGFSQGSVLPGVKDIVIQTEYIKHL